MSATMYCDVLVESSSATSYHAYHYSDVILGAVAYQSTSLTIVYSTFYSGADQRKYQSSASLAFVFGEFTGTGE